MKKIALFLIFTVLLTIISSLISELSMDSIWNFGFSYNIANGLIPYKDFNMIIGPFYNLIVAVFIKLFGNYMIVFQIANSIIISIFMIPIYHKIKNNTIYFILFLGILPVIYSYNTFCAFLVIGILILEDSHLKYKDSFIGFFIGMMIMTKHNIGLVLLLVAFIISKNKLKLTIGTIIPIIITYIYLIYNHTLLAYIDFCYLGLGKFLDNFRFEFHALIIMGISLYLLMKEYYDTKDKKIFYIIC